VVMTDCKSRGGRVIDVRILCGGGRSWCPMRYSVVEATVCCRALSTMMFRLGIVEGGRW